MVAWSDAEIVNSFLGRLGGVSIGPYESLNLSYRVGDDAKAVDTNWIRLRERLPRRSVFARLNQVHSNAVHRMDSLRIDSEVDGQRFRGDGMVTRVPGVILGVMTADCVPVLMYDKRAGAVGALHAGWRGIIAGIAAKGIDTIKEIGAEPESLRVATGPSIGQCCFEVDRVLATRFEREIPAASAYIREGKPGKACLDLKGILADQFRKLGVAADSISAVGPCTRCARDEFFSRRGAGGATTGLQMSFIGLVS